MKCDIVETKTLIVNQNTQHNDQSITPVTYTVLVINKIACYFILDLTQPSSLFFSRLFILSKQTVYSKPTTIIPYSHAALSGYKCTWKQTD